MVFSRRKLEDFEGMFPLDSTDVIICENCGNVQLIHKSIYRNGLYFCSEECAEEYELQYAPAEESEGDDEE